MNVADNQVAVLAFRLDDQYYGLSIAHVLEVAAMIALTQLPDSAPAVLGAANRRGAVLPMLDLRVAFGLPTAPVHAETLFIVADAGQQKIGLVVDEILQVKYMHGQSFVTAQGSGSFVSHLISDDDRVFQIIALQSILETVLPAFKQNQLHTDIEG